MADVHSPDPLIEALRAWPDAVAAADAMFLKGESDPRTRGTGHFVYVLDRTPDWERFVRVWERASRILPPLYKRIIRSPIPGQLPLWRDDPDFDLKFHLRRLSVPAPGSLREVLDYAEADGMTPHDPGRPLWQVTLMEGLDGDGAALLLKFHHSWMDGNASVQLAHLIYDTARDADLDKPMPARLAPVVRSDPSPAVTVALAPLEAARLVQKVVHFTARLAMRVITDPSEAVARTTELAASTRRMLTPTSATPSPLLLARSPGSRFEVLDVSFPDLRRAAKSIDCTVNDAYLAGVAGGIRRYHEHFGVKIDAIPTGMPISTRSADDAALGNQVAAAMIGLPVGVIDPVKRMKRIHAIVLGARYEPAMEALSGAAEVLVRLPESLMSGPLAQLVKIDLGVSQVRGLLEPSYLAGTQIMRTYGLGPHTGLAVFIGMMTHLDVCCIGVHADPAAVSDPELFLRSLTEGFDEVLAVGRPAPRQRPAKRAAKKLGV
jgi:diacylglycerol O-acyltransferase